MRLLPEDFAFIETIQEEISEHSAIPLEIKPDRIKTIIGDCAKYFYEYHPQAIQRQHLIVKASDVRQARVDNMNAVLKLPDAVKFIFRIRKINGASSLSKATYLSSKYMGMGRFLPTIASGGFGGVGSFGLTSGGFRDMTSVTLAMYEYSTFNSLSSNNRGVAHNWSELTKNINFLSDVTHDMVFEVGVEIPVSNMYNDLWFKNYVKGHALKSLSKIIGTYDFRLIGGVTINFEQLSSDGQEMIDKVEEELAKYNTHGFIVQR